MKSKPEPTTVHDLPHELISYIFSIGRDGDSASVPYLRAISSVCSVWRNVAISTAVLWSAIVYEPCALPPLDLPYGFFPPLQIEPEARRVCERVGTFLERSGSAPIDLVLIMRDHSEEHVRRIANVVMPHLWRCRSLIIRHNDDFVNQILLPLPGHLEQLEKLELLSHSHPFSGAVTVFPEHGASPLRSLCLRMAWGATDFIPTNTLTHLDLQLDPKYINQAKFIQFLGRCTVLERLRLSESTIHELVPDNDIPVSLPSLKILHVNDTLALSFTMRLHTPNIVELCLYNNWRPPEFPDVPPTMLQMETVTWDFQPLKDIRPHHLMPFSSVKKLILRNCAQVSFFVHYLAGFRGESGQAPSDPPEAYPESKGNRLFPWLEYLEITARARFERGVLSSWFKVLLDHRPSLRVAVDPFIAEDAAVVAAQFGPRFAVLRKDICP